MLLPSKGDATIGGGTEESGVHLKKIKRSSLKRKGQAIKVIGFEGIEYIENPIKHQSIVQNTTSYFDL